jgi:hypothetical protein
MVLSEEMITKVEAVMEHKRKIEELETKLSDLKKEKDKEKKMLVEATESLNEALGVKKCVKVATSDQSTTFAGMSDNDFRSQLRTKLTYKIEKAAKAVEHKPLICKEVHKQAVSVKPTIRKHLVAMTPRCLDKVINCS